MREIVIVIADLYWPRPGPSSEAGFSEPDISASPRHRPSTSDASESSSPASVPRGVEHMARFGTRSLLDEGWRAWLARWLGREDLASAAPGSIAAAALPRSVTESFERSTGERSQVWIATPLHWVAGLTSLHLDRRSILRLPPSELQSLADDFQCTFQTSGFSLHPVGSGDFLMLGPNIPGAHTTEPARSLIADVAESLPHGAGSSVLRRLGAEIEMWLHTHPVNAIRTSRGEPPVTALWLWGGGPLRPMRSSAVSQSIPVVAEPRSEEHQDLAFGSDAYVAGLWPLHGQESKRLPDQLDDIFGYPRAQRAALVLEVAQVLHSHPKWTVFEAMAEIDRRFISPALEALRRNKAAPSKLAQNKLESVVLIANDRRLTVRARDRLKWWRRSHPGLEGLR